jgi:ABC-type polysaccharide/polyol phosphate export permease
LTSIATYRRSRELYYNLTLRELRSKYKRSVLGWTWSLFNPLAMVAVFTVLFKFFLKARLDVGQPSGLRIYALYLMSGLLPWNYFQISVNNSIGSLISNSALIKKTYFPRELLPASAVGAGLVTHVIEMGLLIVALLIFGDWRAIVFLPLALVVSMFVALAALGFGLALSALNVYFRDIEHFMSIFFLVWLYMTPIVYPLYDVPLRIRGYLSINPMSDMVGCYRSLLYDGTWPNWLQFAYFAGFAMLSVVVGLAVFNKFESRLAEEL